MNLFELSVIIDQFSNAVGEVLDEFTLSGIRMDDESVMIQANCDNQSITIITSLKKEPVPSANDTSH